MFITATPHGTHKIGFERALGVFQILALNQTKRYRGLAFSSIHSSRHTKMGKIHYTVVATILFYCNILFAYGPNEAYEDAMNNDPRIYLLLFVAAISSLPFIAYKKYIKLKHGNETNIISKAVKQSLSDCGFFAVTFWIGGIVFIVVSLLIISIISMLSVNMSHVFASFLHSSNPGIIYLITIIWWVICLVWNINKLED